MPIDIDEFGAANIRIDPNGNIECTDDGLAYSGTILPPVVDTTMCIGGCEDPEHSALRQDGLGRPWAPTVGCTQRVLTRFNGTEPGIEIAPGFPRHVPASIQTVTLATDLCYAGQVCSFVSGSLGVSMPGARKQVNFDMLVNGQPGVGAMEWDYTSPGIGANAHRLTISGRVVHQTIQPGETATITAQMVISNGPQASANIGLFGWDVAIATTVLAIPECG